MRIVEIYRQYSIPTGLQQHHLSTAALGKYIVDHWQGPAIDGQAVIATLLVHDLGNLVKFDLTENAKVIDLSLFTDHWRGIQSEMRTKYGTHAHGATQAILRELGLSEKIRHLADHMDAADICKIVDDSLDQQICQYADMRVVPKGIVSMADRFADLTARYKGRATKWSDDAVIAKNWQCAKQIEARLQQHTNVDLINIPPEEIEHYLVELPLFDVPTNSG